MPTTAEELNDLLPDPWPYQVALVVGVLAVLVLAIFFGP